MADEYPRCETGVACDPEGADQLLRIVTDYEKSLLQRLHIHPEL